MNIKPGKRVTDFFFDCQNFLKNWKAPLHIFIMGYGGKMKRIAILIMIFPILASQWFTSLGARGDDPLYSTYISLWERSNYFIDEGYHLRYYENDLPLSLVTDTAGEIQIAWGLRGMLCRNIQDYFSKPVINTSLADYASMEFMPFSTIKATSDLFLPDSRTVILDFRAKNTSRTKEDLKLYLVIKKGEGFFQIEKLKGGVSFHHREPWKKWFSTPVPGYSEWFSSALIASKPPTTTGIYRNSRNFIKRILKEGRITGDRSTYGEIIVLEYSIPLSPMEEKHIRIVRRVSKRAREKKNIEKTRRMLSFDYSPLVEKELELYKKIPVVNFKNREEKLVYLGGFSLVLQSFYPPLEKARHPFYVFSREPTWNWGHEGQVFHESLSMLALSLVEPELAQESQRIFIDRQRDDGFIPYRIGPFVTKTFPMNSQASTSAPFFNWTNLEIYKQSGDKKFLREAYKSGKAFALWILKNRDTDGDGLLEWGANAVLECVRDDFVAVWNILGGDYSSPSALEALDLSAMMVKELRALQKMAAESGYKEDEKMWKARADKLSGLINKYMWDHETGFYYNLFKQNNSFVNEKGQSIKRKEIIGFLPMWAGIADKEQARALMKHLKNPSEFWRRFGVPTLSADDPYYDGDVMTCCRWNGPVWLLWDYMIIEGLRNYGYTKEAEQVFDKILNAVVFQLKRNHRFWESYSPDNTLLHSPQSYLWDSIISRIIWEFRR